MQRVEPTSALIHADPPQCAVGRADIDEIERLMTVNFSSFKAELKFLAKVGRGRCPTR